MGATTPFASLGDPDIGSIQVERYSLSLADQAADILRRYIILGRLKAGAKLSERTLAAQLGISPGPAREALLQLEREGLVVTQTDGRHVVELTEHDVLELIEVRKPLEKLAAARTAERMTPEIAAELRASLEPMRKACTTRDMDALLASDREIHRTIWRHSGNQRVFEILDALIGPLWTFFYNQPNRPEETSQAFWDRHMAHHDALVDAILSGDPAAVQGSIERHNRNSLRKVLPGGFDSSSGPASTESRS